MNCSACPQLPLPTVSLRAGVLNFAASAPSETLLKMQVLQPLSRQGTLTTGVSKAQQLIKQASK